MDKLIDLHMHTYYSDGEYSPKKIVEFVKEKNVGTFSITDHDTILGAKEAQHFLDDTLNYIPGIELSAKSSNGTMHILGYYIDLNNNVINNKLSELKQRRADRAIFIINYIRKKYGLQFDEEDLYNLLQQKHNIGRPHIAKLCINYGYAKDTQDAFDKYLIDAGAKTQEFKLLPQECISLIHNAGGIPVLAHPKSLKQNYEDLRDTIKYLVNQGLQGIEVYNSIHSDRDTEEFMKISQDMNLLYSGGTDFHGPGVKPNVEVGTGINNSIKIKRLSIIK